MTEQGRHLMRLYSELDLVAAECLRRGLWDDLSVSELAAVLSVLVFEARRPDDASAPRMPGGRVKGVVAEMVTLWAELDALEREHHLDFLRQPDLGFAWAAYRWAEGDELDDVLTEVDLAAGDFVRWMKQLLDVAGQVADAAGDSPLREHGPRRRPGAAARRGRLLGARRRLTTRSGLAWVAAPSQRWSTSPDSSDHACARRPRTGEPRCSTWSSTRCGPIPTRASRSSSRTGAPLAAYLGPRPQPPRRLAGAPEDEGLAQDRRTRRPPARRSACGVDVRALGDHERLAVPDQAPARAPPRR